MSMTMTMKLPRVLRVRSRFFVGLLLFVLVSLHEGVTVANRNEVDDYEEGTIDKGATCDLSEGGNVTDRTNNVVTTNANVTIGNGTIGIADGGTIVNGTCTNTTNANTATATIPNVIFILSDQQIFYALGFIQKRMADFAGKLHVRTPNIDALAEQGFYFEYAYCVSPLCAPARVSVMTGTTVQRHGVLHNEYMHKNVYSRMSNVKRKIKSQASFEQILVEEHGFVAENYGKWHAPKLLYYGHSNKGTRVIDYNLYDETEQPAFKSVLDVEDFYPDAVKTLVKKDNVTIDQTKRSQYNMFSGFSYTPAIPLDPHYYGNSPEKWQSSDIFMCGVDDLPDEYSSTAVTAKWTIKALERLAANKTQPFLLSMHVVAPHPPFIPSSTYAPYYLNKSEQLFVPPSINDNMINTAYRSSYFRRLFKVLGKKNYPFNKKSNIAGMTALTYAMIEEIDYWVGKLMEAVDQMGIREQTMLIFTSDHGHMLGAHGLVEKQVLLEESVRIPLLISLPGLAGAGTTITQPVSHLDLHSTILDYVGASHLDESDGTSLRRFMEGLSYNTDFDETTVVVEADYRIPIDKNHFASDPGEYPHFMIRKGNYKLMMHKLASLPVLDMMYNLEADPYEMNNLIGKRGPTASDTVVGKAEHLRILLLEWLQRMNGPQNLYSNPKYNLNVGRGDITEIRKRQTWRSVMYWQSDDTLTFGPLVLVDGNFTRHEYFYVGRSLNSAKPLCLSNIRVEGGAAFSQFFSVEKTSATINKVGYVRIKVSLVAPQPLPWNNTNSTSIDAQLTFETNLNNNSRKVPIFLE